MNSEAIVCLEAALTPSGVGADERIARARRLRAGSSPISRPTRHRTVETARATVIVVDTHVVAYLYLPCQFTAIAEALLQDDPDWTAPQLWKSEFRNVLAGYLRHGILMFDQAIALQLEAEALLHGSEYEIDSREVLQLVRDSPCSAYDCEFVGLALALSALLVTMDKKVLQAFPNVATPLSET
jgi:predicted nucleic acid-binding protein